MVRIHAALAGRIDLRLWFLFTDCFVVLSDHVVIDDYDRRALFFCNALQLFQRHKIACSGLGGFVEPHKLNVGPIVNLLNG